MADSARLDALIPLLDQAMELEPEPEQLRAWLAELARTQPESAEAIASLLAREALLDARGFLQLRSHPIPALDAPTLAGRRVGAYTLERPIGQGGMGSVWLARRSDGRFDGTVAVKLLNLALLDPVGSERFRREGTTLARLIQPNIARLIDAGVTESGQPYLLLEYVDGMRIDRYCDEQRLDPHRRLELFDQVLAAVAHAHVNLIVHRDLKPSNILVSRDGAVKLLDFGIAKLLEDDAGSAERTELTDVGGSPLSPEYAAPEQVNGQPVTTATDVYSLGVLLYLLLAGRHPTGGGSRSSVEQLRAVTETRPRRLSAEIGADSAALRNGTPEQLRRAYAGDLDNILEKALEKEPARRYPTVNALAQDLSRHRRHEPVEARSPSLAYRLRKFARRNRTGVVAGVVTVSALLAATALTSLQALNARQQRDEARSQRDRAVFQEQRASASNGFMQTLLSGIHPAERVSTLELLERARVLLELDYSSDPRFVARMMLDLSGQFGPHISMPTQRALLERAVERAAAARDPELEAEAHCDLARFHAAVYLRSDSAQPHLARAAQSLSRVARPGAAARTRCLIAESRTRLIVGDNEGALALSARALELAEGTADTGSEAFARLLIEAAEPHRITGRLRSALSHLRRAIKILEQVGRGRTVQMLNARMMEHASLEQIGDWRAADVAFHELRDLAAGLGDGYAATIENLSAHRALSRDQPDSAAAIWAKKLERQRRAGDPGAANTLWWLGRSLIAAGRLREAKARLVELSAMPVKDSLEVLMLKAILAEADGRPAVALDLYRAVLAQQGYPELRFPRPFLPYVARAARMALLTGDAAAADSLAARAHMYARQLEPENGFGLGRVRLVQAKSRLQLGDTAAALEFAAQAAEAMRDRPANGIHEIRDATEARELADRLAAPTADRAHAGHGLTLPAPPASTR